MLQPLHPPFRFGVVEEDVYRGAYPRDRNFQFLKRLKPKTVLSLIPEQPNDSLVKFCFENGINNLWIRVIKPKENVPLSYSKIIRCLQVLLHAENLPVYIHCLDGTVVTGMVVACLRKLQLWSVSTAMTEYLRFISEEEIRSEEREFVGKFNSPIEIPVDFPRWLWKGLNVSPISNFKHPSIPCKFLESEAHDLLPVEPHHHYLHLTRAEARQNKTSADTLPNFKKSSDDNLAPSNFSLLRATSCLPPVNPSGEVNPKPSNMHSQAFADEDNTSNSQTSKESSDQLSMTVKALALESFRP